jgi:hypothetical protein
MNKGRIEDWFGSWRVLAPFFLKWNGVVLEKNESFHLNKNGDKIFKTSLTYQNHEAAYLR